MPRIDGAERLLLRMTELVGGMRLVVRFLSTCYEHMHATCVCVRIHTHPHTHAHTHPHIAFTCM